MRNLILKKNKVYLVEELIKVLFDVDSSFVELCDTKREKLIDYISKNKLEVKFLGKRGYDVLINKFFVYELNLTDYWLYYQEKEPILFDDFASFFEYTLGGIYKDSCFFGYNFSDEDIQKYNIKIEKINFKAFIKDNISKYSLKNLLKLQKEKYSKVVEEVEILKKWINDYQLPKTYNDLCEGIKEFRRYRLHYDDRVFFSLIIGKYSESIRQLIVEYFDNENLEKLFDDILLVYGEETAINAIENYKPKTFAPSTIYAKRSRFKKVLSEYRKNALKLEVKKYYCLQSGMFQVSYIYRKGGFFLPYISLNKYFFTLDEFANYLKGDLRGCDLSNAPITIDGLHKYNVDETTITPQNFPELKHIIKKGFDKGEFYVIQKWVDQFGNVVVDDEPHTFDYLCDFIFFLKNDISGSDLVMCDGISCLSRLDGIIYNGIHVRSEDAANLGLPIETIDNNIINSKGFELSQNNELATIEEYNLERQVFEERRSYIIQYITDIHLEHRIRSFNCKTKEDIVYALRSLANDLNIEYGIKLIGGDIAHSFNLYKYFIESFAENNIGTAFVTLGNHELWSFKDKSLDEIVDEYRELLNKNKIYLVHNNLYYLQGDSIKEITTDELSIISTRELRERTRDANLIIFGGIGYSGMNELFNANNNIYDDLIDRDEEIELSDSFYELYQKIAKSLYDKNVIILTHMPFIDWAGKEPHIKGFVYVSGHNHRNYFYDDGSKRIYSDNQIGYRTSKSISLKKFDINMNYDWFSEYEDGIYEITRDDYLNYYRGIGQPINFNRDYNKLYMIKREDIYLFMVENTKGELMLLNGGAVRKISIRDVEYYYEHLVDYSNSIKLFLSEYYKFQKDVSKEIISIGGTGSIHGCIVDIDFWNHIYINPLDGKLTPYNALDIVRKNVYTNLLSLLNNECPKLYAKYVEETNKGENSSLYSIISAKEEISSQTKPYYETDIYKISNNIKSLQYTLKYNVVRLWNDSLLGEPTVEKGRALVEGILELSMAKK